MEQPQYISLHKKHRLLLGPNYIVLFEYPYELLKQRFLRKT